jgi:hypothetical protein
MRTYGRTIKKNKKPVFKKQWPDEKLFTVNNFPYNNTKFLLQVGSDVIRHAQDNLGLNLTKPKQLESYLRKSFRALFGYKV